jgi:hypothetical protein
MQGLTTLLSQQRAKLLGLVDTYCRMTGMTGPHLDEELAIVDHPSAEVCGGSVLTHANALLFIDEKSRQYQHSKGRCRKTGTRSCQDVC